MVKIRIGIRRLFEAVECSITESGTLDVSKSLSNGFLIRISLGPKPLFGKHIIAGAGKYLIVNPPTCMGNLGPYVPLSNPPDGFFTEIICCKEIEIPDEDYASLKNNNTISSKLFAIIHEEKYVYLNEINWYAGLIGMKIHRQFVTEPIIEHSLICNTDWSSLSIPYNGPGIEQIFKIPLPKDELPIVEKIFESHPNQELLGKYGIAFEWLLRAWTLRGRDRFIALFIPLEIAINSLNLKVNTNNSELIEELRKSCSNAELVDVVKKRIETLTRPPQPDPVKKLQYLRLDQEKGGFYGEEET